MTSASVPPTDNTAARVLRARLLTAAALGGALVLLILYGSTILLAGVLAVFLALAAREWALLCHWSRAACAAYVAATLAFAAAGWLALTDPALQRGLLLPVIAGWFAAACAVVLAERAHHALPRQAWALAVIGWWVLVPTWLSLLWLKALGPALLLALLALIWLADSAAYFVGRRYGRRKLAPHVSPGKTWAGCIGALVAAPVVAGIFGAGQSYDGAMLAGFGMLCLATVVASVVGDLFESLLKRRAGVKDSGALLPGHGGVLDRIDSLTAAAPIFFWGLSLLGLRT